MKSKKPYLSVVIPAYNEQHTIESALFDVYFEFFGVDIEVIVVDDHSTDKTPLILKKLQKKYKRLYVLRNRKNMGHGYSVIRGIDYAIGDYVLYIDADRQIRLNHIFGITFGEFLSGRRVGRKDPLFRKIVSFCLKMTILIRHGYYIPDANCPYKLYMRHEVQNVILSLPKTRVIPIACIEVLARRMGYTTKTINTPHIPYKGVRKGTLQTINKKSLKFFWEAFKEIWAI